MTGGAGEPVVRRTGSAEGRDDNQKGRWRQRHLGQNPGVRAGEWRLSNLHDFVVGERMQIQDYLVACEEPRRGADHAILMRGVCWSSLASKTTKKVVSHLMSRLKL